MASVSAVFLLLGVGAGLGCGMLIGLANGGFKQFATFASGGTTPNHLVAADFDRDGKPDLAIANNLSNNVTFLAGDGADP